MKTKKNTLKLLANNWVVTLTGTLIGVFAALYLNENMSSEKIEKRKDIVTNNILLEIKKNKENIEKSIYKWEKTLSVMTLLKNHSDKEGRLIVNADSMRVFKAKFPDTFIAQDSTLLRNGKYHYKGTMNADFGMNLYNLWFITWETLKSSDLFNSFNFHCLNKLENINVVQKDILAREKRLLDRLYDLMHSNASNEEKDNSAQRVLQNLEHLISIEKGLLELYEHTSEQLKNCALEKE